MNVVGVILGGGAGTRLQPLTRDRSKPAVPVGGKYRLVDIPISNCINSDIRQIYLLTQFNSVSLHDHVQNTYQFDAFNKNFLRILAAQQTPDAETWYKGTADAVRKTFRYFLDADPDYVVILSGDQLYRTDFNEVMKHHVDNKAEVTILTKPVPRDQAGSLGIMEVNKTHRITNFVEKPGDTADLDPLRAPMYDDERYLASMGIYVFNTKVLEKLLENDHEDFGKDIIPMSIKEHDVFSYIYEGYWRDIGTIESFLDANLGLTDPDPEFTFYDARAPIYTHGRFLPPSQIANCTVERGMISEGSKLRAASIKHSIVGVRGRVGTNSVVEDSYIMGADYYEEELKDQLAPGTPKLGIGRDCVIKRAIIDKNARIGDGVTVSPEGKPDGETALYTIRDGIIVIPKNAVIPDGHVL
jgi:glucose-1-phosphate adenylyltransferase